VSSAPTGAPSSAYALPVFISESGKKLALRRLVFEGAGADRYDEAWLQELLFRNPEILPTAQIDSSYQVLIPVCRELGTFAGPVDLLYVTPDGNLVLVETKLWRNAEARRKVVAQILDYAKEIAQWDYDYLNAQIMRLKGQGGRSLFDIAKARDPGIDHQFMDRVTRNLRMGRFLLLIAGDGIREGVEHLTDFLDRLGRLEFTFGLVEVAMYRHPEGGLFVQPRVLAKTMIVKRSVIQIEDNRAAVVSEGGEDQEEVEAESLDAKAQFYERYWKEFLEKRLRLDDATQPLPTPGRSTNIFFSMPPSGSQAWVSAFFAQSTRTAGVYLRFAKGVFGDTAYQQLLEDKQAIERELGVPVEWSSRDGKNSVASRITYADLAKPEEIERITSFFADRLNRFVTVFRPRLRKIADA